MDLIDSVSKLFTGGIGDLMGQVGNIVDKFHLSPQEKQEFELEMEALLQKRNADIEDTLRTQIQARQAVTVAELAQGDTYTKRARPTVVYVGLVFIFLNYCLIPGIQLVRGTATARCTAADGQVTACAVQPALSLPDNFWWAWGGIVATWSIGRSFEKSGASNSVTRAITGSAAPRDGGAVG